MQQSTLNDHDSHDYSDVKPQLTLIEHNESQSQVFIDTEQSNPFFRKINTNFHEAEDVDLLNNIEERPKPQIPQLSAPAK